MSTRWPCDVHWLTTRHPPVDHLSTRRGHRLTRRWWSGVTFTPFIQALSVFGDSSDRKHILCCHIFGYSVRFIELWINNKSIYRPALRDLLRTQTAKADCQNPWLVTYCDHEANHTIQRKCMVPYLYRYEQIACRKMQGAVYLTIRVSYSHETWRNIL